MGRKSNEQKAKEEAAAKNKIAASSQPAKVAPSGNQSSNPTISQTVSDLAEARKLRPTKEQKREALIQEIRAEEANKTLDLLFSADNWAGLMRAPADTMLAVTGNDVWNIPDREMAVLSNNAALSARYFMIMDPKWIALTMLGFGLLNTYGTRTVKYILDAKREAKKEQENKKE